MAAGNAAACIGLANTNKQPMIGMYDQGDTPAWGANGNYAGINGSTYWTYNSLGEEKGFTALSTSGATAGKTAQWVTTTAGLAAGTTKVALSAGVATADNATGTHTVSVPAAGIPANAWFWVFEV